MILTGKLRYFLIVTSLLHLSSESDLSNLEDSDDDDKLKQALFLVDILKTEYFKVLRENNQLKKSGGLTSTTEVSKEETATCGLNETHPIENVTDPTVHAERESTTPGSTVTAASTTPGSTVTANLTTLTTLPNKLEVNRRSFNSIDNNGKSLEEIPAGLLNRRSFNGPGDSKNSTAETSITPGLNNTRQSVSDVDLTETESRFSPANISAFLATMARKTAAELKHMNMTSLINVDGDNNANTLQDPVLRQIASELMRELRVDDALRSKKNHTKKSQPSPKTTKSKFKFKEYMKTRTTIKIYLEKSSKLPRPLPENNPFCYFHPTSSICTGYK